MEPKAVTSSGSSDLVALRRQKIKQLKSGLFDDLHTVDAWGSQQTSLPALQNVSEYKDEKRGRARQQGMVSGIRNAGHGLRKKLMHKHVGKKQHDTRPLMEDEDDLELQREEDVLSLSSSGSSTHLSPISKSVKPNNSSTTNRPRLSAQNLLRTELAAVDASIRHLVLDSSDSSEFESGGVRRSVSLDGKTNKSKLLSPFEQQVHPRRDSLASGRELADRSAQILAEEQANLEAFLTRIEQPATKAPLLLQPLKTKAKKKKKLKKNKKAQFGLDRSRSTFEQPVIVSGKGRGVEVGKQLGNGPSGHAEEEEEEDEEDEEETMTDFSGLEHWHNENSYDTLNDMPNNTLKDVPDVMADMSLATTFDDIPDNVFDAIPRAVSGRHRRNLREKANHKNNTKSLKNGNSKDDEQTSMSLTKVVLNEDQPSLGGVTLLTALFPRTINPINDQLDTEEKTAGPVDADFMFALYIERQDRESNNEAANRMKEEKKKNEEDDKDNIGHFCAPDVPGFCEANHCIFHTASSKAL